MPTLRTRAAKGSALSYTEGDDNLKRPVTQKTADYTLLVSDNRSVIECSHASTPITITLGAAATMAAAETGDYAVTIININYAPVTITPSGADTIEGSTQGIELGRGQAVDLTVNSSGSGYINRNGRDKGENLFIGSNLTTNPWQRGTSTTVTTSNTYFADRFCLTFDGTANLTAEKVTLASPQKIMGQWCNNAMKVTVNSSSGNTYLRLIQRVEDVTTVADQAAYLQTAIQGSASFSVPLQLRRNYGTGGTPTSEETTAFDANLSVTTSLAVLSSGLVVPSLSAKTLGTDGLHTSYIAVEYNLINVPVGGHVIIPIAKFEAGSSGTMYPKEDREQVLAGCERYYEKSYNISDAPGTVTNNGAIARRAASNFYYATAIFRARKRTTPSYTVYDPITGNPNTIRGGTSGALTGGSVLITGETSAVWDVATAIDSEEITFHWVADSEIY